jgi:methionine biosynthesis protein MetW
MKNKALRDDLALISEWIPPYSRVLDLGCGRGDLLLHLQNQGAQSYGLDIDPNNIATCIERGLQVIQTDLDEGLRDFDDHSFDVVVLTQTLQALQRPDQLLAEMLRVGRRVIVTFPNFGHWRVRWALLRGQMPVTPSLPERWYDTPNIHFCTVTDFESLCHERGWPIVRRALMSRHLKDRAWWPNLFSEVAMYELSGRSGEPALGNEVRFVL